MEFNRVLKILNTIDLPQLYRPIADDQGKAVIKVWLYSGVY